MGASSGSPGQGGLAPPHTRVAIPEDGLGYKVVDVSEESFPEFCRKVTSMVADALRGHGVEVPATALREIIDNLVHAVPCTASVVLAPSFRNIYISDTGPGIPRPDLAFELGFSTADASRRSLIRGVGLGLYLARRDVQSTGGDLAIESVPGGGTYVTISLTACPSPKWDGEAVPYLSQRQNNILFLLSEGELLGPSEIAAELNTSVSTAHRDLVKMQRMGLVFVVNNGKRALSPSGRSYLQGLLSL